MDGGDSHGPDFPLESAEGHYELSPRPLQVYPDLPDLPPANEQPGSDIVPWPEPVGLAHLLLRPYPRSPPQPQRRPPAFPYMPFNRPSTSTASVRSRPSDTHSFTSDTLVPSVSDMSIGDPRKGKNSLNFFSGMMKKRSRLKLASSDSINDSMATFATLTPSPSQLSVNTYTSSLHRDPTPDLPPLPVRRDKERPRKGSRLNKPQPFPPNDEPLLTIDTDFSHIEDFIDVNATSGTIRGRPSASSSSGFDSSSLTLSNFTPPSPSPSVFTDPFHPASVPSKRRYRYDRKISPKTIMEPRDPDVHGEQLTEYEWTAPESWEIEKEGTDAATAGASSGSEESIVASSLRTPDSSSISTDSTSRKRTRRKTHHAHKPASSTSSSKPVLVRIYRANGSYHVAQIPPHATVADLTPSLNAKVLRDHERETHRLYLKERGRGM